MSTPYTPSHRLRSILSAHPHLINTLSRFSIPLGFGDATVEQVCRNAGVDTATFLAVVATLTSRDPGKASVHLPTLLRYLRNSHRFFTGFVLPRLRRDLIEAISSDTQGDLTVMLLKFYDDFTDEVQRHMLQEEQEVFDAIDSMLAGKAPEGFSIDSFSATHHPMDAKLGELKEIFVCHYHGTAPSADLLNHVLHDLVHCEREIAGHGRVEEQLLVPAVRALEGELDNREPDTPPTPETAPAQQLTQREREIVAAIAHGLGNKQIADRLCVSVHTVTTHRRNICAKLDIHSPAGLTIYALIHGIINIDELKEAAES